MNPAWIGVIGAIGGAVIGGGISYFNTRQQLKHQERSDKRKNHVAKLQELSEELEKLALSILTNTAYMATLKPQGDTDLMAVSERLVAYKKARTLTLFYGSDELGEPFFQVQSGIAAYIKAAGECIDKLNQGVSITVNDKCVVELTQHAVSVENACLAMSVQVAGIAKKYIS